MWRKVLSIILIVAAAALSIFLWFRLPEKVVSHYGLDGKPSQTTPKVLAIGLPLVLTVVGAVLNLTDRTASGKKALAASIVGLIVMFTVFFLNR